MRRRWMRLVGPWPAIGVVPAAALAMAISASAAAASPLEDTTAGGAVFTGPTQGHATSIFLNPAALGFSGRGWHFFVSGNVRYSTLSIDRQVADPNNDGALSNGPSVSTSTLSPGGIVSWYTSVGDRAHFGMAVHAPFYERFVADEENLRYHSLGGTMLQTLISAAGSFKLHDRFIFGVGLSLGYTALSLEFARDTALEDGIPGLASDCGGSPCGFENDQATERYAIDVSTPGFGGLFAAKSLALSLGVAIEIKREWWLGVSYVSPPGAIPSATFDLDLTGKVEVITAPRDGSETLNGEAEITFRMPQSALVGIRGPIIPRHDLVADLRWQNFSRQKLFDIQMFGGNLADGDVPTWYPRLRGFRDVYRLSVGLERQTDARLRYGGRLRLETGAVSSKTITPLQIEGASLTLAGGAEFRVTQQLVVALGYDLSWFPKVESGDENIFNPQDRIVCVESQFDLNKCESTRNGSALPTAAGTYGRIQHALSLSLRYDSL